MKTQNLKSILTPGNIGMALLAGAAAVAIVLFVCNALTHGLSNGSI